eukprot:COSAG01_NODE_45517_length_408_cov_8.394822_1_plen_35_part_01
MFAVTGRCEPRELFEAIQLVVAVHLVHRGQRLCVL